MLDLNNWVQKEYTVLNKFKNLMVLLRKLRNYKGGRWDKWKDRERLSYHRTEVNKC